jgi:hypothetical protein
MLKLRNYDLRQMLCTNCEVHCHKRMRVELVVYVQTVILSYNVDER